MLDKTDILNCGIDNVTALVAVGIVGMSALLSPAVEVGVITADVKDMPVTNAVPVNPEPPLPFKYVIVDKSWTPAGTVIDAMLAVVLLVIATLLDKFVKVRTWDPIVLSEKDGVIPIRPSVLPRFREHIGVAIADPLASIPMIGVNPIGSVLSGF